MDWQRCTKGSRRHSWRSKRHRMLLDYSKLRCRGEMRSTLILRRNLQNTKHPRSPKTRVQRMTKANQMWPWSRIKKFWTLKMTSITTKTRTSRSRSSLIHTHRPWETTKCRKKKSLSKTSFIWTSFFIMVRIQFSLTSNKIRLKTVWW